ncbi:MAG TPA: hypothetical protein DCL41_03295 [Bdellovibrionales bacterium]|nr:hypothetical protein [Pseudobdellovibrionaceae bacterium]HAG90866.1 hypothetical protein [Bdellovibrionales bacterium]|tara:strand:+ start:1690 stop:2370 length:681 start_codon:yes stop_codon:yes gene_type:complete
MYVLLVEPDPELASYLKKGLGEEGFSVSHLSSALEVEALLSIKDSPNPYVILLSSGVMHSRKFLVLDLIKSRYEDVPVIVLTGKNDSHEKSEYLDRGADDCMNAPISLEELSARIRAIRRRWSAVKAGLNFRVGNTSLDLSGQCAYVEGFRLGLSRKEYEVLRLLMEHPKRVYNKVQILDQVWDVHSDVESNVVEVTIKNLRKKLGEKSSSLKIESRRHFGYWLED